MTTHEPLTDEELAAIEDLAEAATPGPWFVRHLDDEAAMNLVAISTVPDTGRGERWPNFDHHEIVAATLIQRPRYVDVADELWDENAQFVANARQDVPRLIAEIKRLRQLLAQQGQQDFEA
ncbi:hypothetical protein ACFPOI_43495 [Nonomuraea angiospora]|uniref:Uncharacterized protein n=1 Tax=Nonomuraea angiospora TaxID=46172 RepID=A0ABR9LV79_9ACTN|nr:hypothetical protein [Nonomuraea angiospora]MBE1584559.1 hypothetical protein [Nonomuraea angiospora]